MELFAQKKFKTDLCKREKVKSQKPLFIPSKHNFPDASNKPQGTKQIQFCNNTIGSIRKAHQFWSDAFSYAYREQEAEHNAVMDNRVGNRWQRLELTSSIEQCEGSAGLDLALWLGPFKTEALFAKIQCGIRFPNSSESEGCLDRKQRSGLFAK